MTYIKASVEVICFDNSDVITTSGLDGTNDGDTGCWTNGHDRGNGCNGNSGNCPEKHSWK